MEPFTLPDKKGRFTQPNDGDGAGNLYMTYNIDLESERGRVKVSPQVKKLVTDADNANFNGYAAAIRAYSLNGSTGKIFAVSDKAFSASIASPLGTWSEETAGSEPDSGNTIMDAVFFNGLFLVCESDDIKAWNGSTWSSWWVTTLGKSNLTTGDRHILWVGPDGNLYIVDNGNKVFRVTPTGSVSTSGNGTLDFSATQYELTCAVPNSYRSFIGTRDLTGEEAMIIEWDMSPASAAANKLHPVGAKGVRCIAVWNDIPIAILSNGKVKYFNGSSFVEFETKIQFPVSENNELDEDFIHPNGWAIIDDLPHFLITGRINASDGTALSGVQEANYAMPSGVWCLDPSIGLYHRFALGTGQSTQEDYGKMSIREVGALFSLQNTESKFLASYEYYLDNQTDIRSVLVYHDALNTKPSRGYIMTPFIYSLREKLKNVEIFNKPLASGEKVRIYYRHETDETLAQSGTWMSTTQFNITGTSLGIAVGDVAFVKMGPGSGQLLRVSAVDESSTVTSVTFTEANSFITAGDAGTLDFLNFRYMGVIDSTTKDFHEFVIPTPDRKRKTQFLLEFQQNASSQIEMDYTIIS